MQLLDAEMSDRPQGEMRDQEVAQERLKGEDRHVDDDQCSRCTRHAGLHSVPPRALPWLAISSEHRWNFGLQYRLRPSPARSLSTAAFGPRFRGATVRPPNTTTTTI